MNRKIKAITSFIAVFLIFTMSISQSMVFAATTDDIQWTLCYSGDCGASNLSVEWEFHTHNQSVSDRYYNNRFTLTAGGGRDSGVMENYVYKNYDFYSEYASNGTRKWNSIFPYIYMINIEEGMKVIGDHAFNFGVYYNGISSNLIPYPQDTESNVRYLSLPSTLEEIGFCGFAGALRYVDTLTLPANLSTLDYGAFCGNGFSTIVIEEGNLTKIPSYCFANCTSLEEIYIPKTVKSINSSAFMGCTSLKKIYYGGYSEDWEKVTISEDNDALLSAQVVFPIRVHVSSVTLNTTSKTLMEGNTYTLVATVLPSNADITDVEWTSSKPSVATVSSDGIVTAISAGTTTITATSVEGGIKASCTVSVQAANIAVTGITLNKTANMMNVGTTETLTATVSPSNATNKTVSWKSSNTSVASVSNGVVTANAAGTATITATTADGNKTATCTVTVVTPTVSVTSVSLNKASTTMNVGATETLTATVSPSNATNKTVSWKSSNTSVASVSNGVVTANSVGTATITVTTADGNKTSTCEVVVTDSSVSAKAKFKFENASGRPRDTVKVKLSLKTEAEINSIAISDISFDSNALIFEGFSDYEHIEDLTALPPTFDEDKMAIVIGLKNSMQFDDDICTLNFKIKDTANEGQTSISASSVVKLYSDVVQSSVMPGTVSVCMQVLGDIDGNETVDISDAIALFQYSMLPDLYPITYSGNIDFDKNGTVDISDAVLLFQYSMLPDLYPIE